MPVRILRPTLRQSERWNRCSFFEQSFYIRLITIADDYGRYEAHTALLASECFPYGNADGLPVLANEIDGMLRALASKDLLFVYEFDGKQYFQLTRWRERVRLEKGSHYPDPDKSKIVWKCQSHDWQMSDRCQSDVGNPEITQVSDRKQVARNDSQMTVTCQQIPASPPPPTPTSPPTPVPPAHGVRGNGESPSVKAINNRTELERVEKRLAQIQAKGTVVAGAGGKQYSVPQRAEMAVLKDRREQLKQALGFIA